MSDIAIRVQNLSKQYTIEVARFRHDSLQDHVADTIKSLVRRNGRPHGGKTTFWALKEISLEVKQGEIVGIIGRNGSGKSTLLKILSRIIEPTSGRAEIHGRVGSLLEVGTGFDRELTGRENIYLNGAILGMKKAEINRKFDEIVDFSGVEKFIDTPVKRYSSGMYVRLAFAVAAHLEPEILMVDEVLAVGDAAFQKKCLGKMGDIAKQGRTILLVSHNMAAITHLCGRGIWLDGGLVRGYASAEDAVAQYLAAEAEDQNEARFPDDRQRAPGSEYIRLLACRVRNHEGQVAPSLDIRSPFTVEIEYRILKRVASLRIGFRLIAQDGTVLLTSTDMDDKNDEFEREPGRYVDRCVIPGGFLNCGQYYVSVASDFPMIQVHFSLDRGVAFRIEQTGGIGGSIQDGRLGLLRVQLPWSVTKCDEEPSPALRSQDTVGH